MHLVEIEQEIVQTSFFMRATGSKILEKGKKTKEEEEENTKKIAYGQVSNGIWIYGMTCVLMCIIITSHYFSLTNSK